MFKSYKMKNYTLLLAFICIITSVTAQVNNQAIGVRLGGEMVLNPKFLTNNISVVQIDWNLIWVSLITVGMKDLNSPCYINGLAI